MADDCLASPDPDRSREIGICLGEMLEAGDVIGLSGELGAGKTSLVQGIALGLGVDPQVAVTSPTFTLVGEYPGRLQLRHADFYRVESYARLDDAGFDDLLDGKGVLVVEWPERFPEALPADRLQIDLEIVSAGERRLHLGGSGKRAPEIIRRLLARWR